MKLIILYPGALKPFHDGHLSLLESYISNNDNVVPDIVHIIISPSERGGITAESTLDFIKTLDFSKINKKSDIQIQISNRSPIAACMSICGHSEDPDTCFVMAASDKGDDQKRVNDFNKLYSKGGKYYNENNPNKIGHIDVTIQPLVYTNRKDKFNHKPVSASIVRYDIRNNDFAHFKCSYSKMLSMGIVTEKQLKSYFDTLRNIIDYEDDEHLKLNKLLDENIIDK